VRLSSPGWLARSGWLRMVVAALLLAVCLMPDRAAADEPPAPAWNAEAKRLYQAGMTAYAAKAYDEAAAHFAAAQKVEPHPEILFAEAQARRLAGDCEAATALFDAFLATRPPDAQVEATRIALSRCEPRATVAVGASAGAVDRPAVAAGAPAGAGSDQADAATTGTSSGSAGARAGWYRDPFAGGLAAAALGAWFAAGTFGVLAHRAQSDAEAAQRKNHDAYAAARSSAERRARWALGFAVAGGALAVGAAGRYVWARPGVDGVALGVGGRF